MTQIRERKRLFIWFSLLAALVMMIACFIRPVNVFAEETAQKGSVTIEFPVEGTEFLLYYVGGSDSKGGYILEEPFDSYNVDLTDTKSAAEALAGYVTRDEIAPDAAAVVDEEGKALFEDLKYGVYLIIGETAEKDGKTYTPAPVLLEIPQWQDGELVYDIDVKDKWSETSTTEMTVIKVWKNDEEADRPENIVVQLTKDGKVVDEQELSKDNDWTYSWTNLDPDCVYNVLEKSVPEGYTVSYDKENDKVGITNTGDTETPPEEPEIPQTGQLWWPVSVLLIAGLSLILIGLLVKRKEK